jgi:hypothetical protein
MLGKVQQKTRMAETEIALAVPYSSADPREDCALSMVSAPAPTPDQRAVVIEREEREESERGERDRPVRSVSRREQA